MEILTRELREKVSGNIRQAFDRLWEKEKYTGYVACAKESATTVSLYSWLRGVIAGRGGGDREIRRAIIIIIIIIMPQERVLLKLQWI
jgi:hypothetical protein